MSAYKFLEGFDHWASYADGNGKGWAMWSGASFVAGRFGGQAFKDAGGNGNGGTLALPSNQTTLFAGGAFYSDYWAGSEVNHTLISLISNGTTVGALQLGGLSMLQFKDASSATTTFAVPSLASDTWAYLEIGIIANAAAAAGNVIVRQNGTVVADLSVPTSITGSVYFDHAGFYTPYCGSDGRLDDIYIHNGQGVDASFAGPMQVVTIYPTADISNSGGWTLSAGTSLYSLVNEPQEDGATTTITNGTDGATATFSFTTLSGTLGQILGAQTTITGTAAGGSVAGQISSSGTTSTGLYASLPGAYSAVAPTCFETDPHTGARWTIGGLNAATKGIVKGTP